MPQPVTSSGRVPERSRPPEPRAEGDAAGRQIVFTRSTETGKVVLGLAAKSNLKPVTLELGGRSPMIVIGDADIDQAVELAYLALFFNQGQCSCAGSPTFVHENIYEKFVEKSKARASNRVVGDPFRKGVEQGPQIDEEQFSKILQAPKDGTRIAKEEIFEPVQLILKFSDMNEVIRRANATRYGLAAGVSTSNLKYSKHFNQCAASGDNMDQLLRCL